MDNTKGLVLLETSTGSEYEYDDGNYVTKIFGFSPNTGFSLPDHYTHFGLVVSGYIVIQNSTRTRIIHDGDFFSIVGSAIITSYGSGIITSAYKYNGMNLFGGPLEKTGKLKYINGCTDTLLIPPVRKGDPCFNHLHFPPNTIQTPHTHPSVRVNVVYRGSGICIVPESKVKEVPLVSGYAFIMKTDTIHSFNTLDTFMDVITFHPDSDVGMTDDDHPMVNKTIVEGQSANLMPEIRTKD